VIQNPLEALHQMPPEEPEHSDHHKYRFIVVMMHIILVAQTTTILESREYPISIANNS
jgi:hypothetical protein